jgi:hypothetical protein
MGRALPIRIIKGDASNGIIVVEGDDHASTMRALYPHSPMIILRESAGASRCDDYDGSALFNRCRRSIPLNEYSMVVDDETNDRVLLYPSGEHEVWPPRPPAYAERILAYICTPDTLEECMGDINEIFEAHVAEHGVAAAQRWYCWQVTRLAAALVWKLLESFIRLWLFLH